MPDVVVADLQQSAAVKCAAASCENSCISACCWSAVADRHPFSFPPPTDKACHSLEIKVGAYCSRQPLSAGDHCRPCREPNRQRALSSTSEDRDCTRASGGSFRARERIGRFGRVSLPGSPRLPRAPDTVSRRSRPRYRLRLFVDTAHLSILQNLGQAIRRWSRVANHVGHPSKRRPYSARGSAAAVGALGTAEGGSASCPPDLPSSTRGGAALCHKHCAGQRSSRGTSSRASLSSASNRLVYRPRRALRWQPLRPAGCSSSGSAKMPTNANQPCHGRWKRKTREVAHSVPGPMPQTPKVLAKIGLVMRKAPATCRIE